MQCNRCKLEKSSDDFAWRNKTKEVKHKRCKACQSLMDKESYQRNGRKERIRSRQIASRTVVREFVWQYKSTHPCVDCGESDPIVLDFDHLDNKLYNVSIMVDHSLKDVQAEIAKCEVRCANCHRRVTHYRRCEAQVGERPVEAGEGVSSTLTVTAR
jgi:hypothetical protein